jgi:hypothetical protein
MRRSELLAYLIGAGTAGTLLVGPYAGRWLAATVVPDLGSLRYIPFFLLPIIWGVWNWLHVRLALQLSSGSWGAMLGVVVGVGANLLLLAEGQWFSLAPLALLFLPVLYYLLWLFVVGPLNDALGVRP